MSTNKTKHYQLHSWAAADDFLRTEMNENFTKLDAALKAEETARAGAVSTLQTALGKKPEVVTGAYVGTGEPEQFIALGFTPKVVLVFPESGTSQYRGANLAAAGRPSILQYGTNTTFTCLSIGTGGFTVAYFYVSTSTYCDLNVADGRFLYLALK